MAKKMSSILKKAGSNGKAAKGIEEPSAVKLLSSQEEEDFKDEKESTDTEEGGKVSGDESESGEVEIEEEGEGKGDTGEEEGEVGEDEEDGEDTSALNPVRSFDEMGLDPRLLRGLVKRRLLKPTPVQQYCVPLAMEGRDVVAMAHTGSGKTLAYLLPLLHRVLADKDSAPAATGAGGNCPRAVVLVPTRELCQQVAEEVTAMGQYCGGAITVQRLTTGMNNSAMRAAMERRPDVVVATPARMAACVAEGVLAPSALKTHLAVMVLDEADVLLSHGYYSEVQAIARHVPVSCQCLLLTATFSDDIERLQKLVLHHPVVVRLGDSSDLLEDAQGGVGLGVGGQAAAEAAAAGEVADAGAGAQSNQNQSLLPPNIRQFAVRCEEKDKLLHLLALIRLQLLQKKVLIFTSTVEAGFRVKLFLEQFGIRAAVLNSELPVASRLHILHDFNAGKFFFLIATDDDNGGLSAKDRGKGGNNNGRGDSGRDSKRRRVRIADEAHGGEVGREGEEEVERDTGEYGVVRGIDFKNVRTVINYSVPSQLAPYVHRVGRTGRASSVGMAITLVSPKEAPLLEAIDRKIALSMASAGSEDGKKGVTGVKGESGIGGNRKRAREAEDEEGEDSEEEGEVEEDEEEEKEKEEDEDEEESEELDESEQEEEEESEEEFEEEPAKPKPYECRAIVPYPYLPKEGVEALRYRGEDVAGKITRVAIREARAKELRWEILNSEKLKDHFDLNPKDRGAFPCASFSLLHPLPCIFLCHTRVAIREARAKELRWEILNSEKLKDHFDLNPKDQGGCSSLPFPCFCPFLPCCFLCHSCVAIREARALPCCSLPHPPLRLPSSSAPPTFIPSPACLWSYHAPSTHLLSPHCLLFYPPPDLLKHDKVLAKVAPSPHLKSRTAGMGAKGGEEGEEEGGSTEGKGGGVGAEGGEEGGEDEGGGEAGVDRMIH
ncbi:unnamed protein product [Closterium sp. Naga37s-1]|nr:unnamed protein product [Closterium sp. Naga37s-1]